MGKKCLKCNYERLDTDKAPEYECPNCGAVYSKVEAAMGIDTHHVSIMSDEEKLNAIRKRAKNEKEEKENSSKNNLGIKKLNNFKRKINLDIERMQREREKSKTNHILHLLLTIFTAGFWIIVWFSLAMSNKSTIRSLDKRIIESENGLLEIEEILDEK